MKRHLGFVFALLLLAVAPACAVAATWSLGPNIGFSMLSGQNSTQTVIAWPGDVSGYMPGLRIGYFKKGAPSEFFFDRVRVSSFSYERPDRLTKAAGDVFMFCSDYPHPEGTDNPLPEYRDAGCNPETDAGLFHGNVDSLFT